MILLKLQPLVSSPKLYGSHHSFSTVKIKAVQSKLYFPLIYLNFLQFYSSFVFIFFLRRRHKLVLGWNSDLSPCPAGLCFLSPSIHFSARSFSTVPLPSLPLAYQSPFSSTYQDFSRLWSLHMLFPLPQILSFMHPPKITFPATDLCAHQLIYPKL